MISLKQIIEELDISLLCGNIEREISGGYSSDLLSDVIANAKQNNIWITLQTHVNIVAIASLKDLAGIILVNGRKPENDTLQRAKQEDIPILSTKMQTYEIAGKLYELGIYGNRE